MGREGITVAGRALAVALLALASVASQALAQGFGGGERVSGDVTSVDADGTVWLDNGASLMLAPNPRITLTRGGTADDLSQGQFAAITATRLPDGTLLASQVRVFPSSVRIPGGQFPLDETNIMTNASIDQAAIDMVSGSQLQVSFQDRIETVNLLPVTEIVVQLDGTMDDVVVGSHVSANVTNGTAGSLTVSV